MAICMNIFVSTIDNRSQYRHYLQRFKQLYLTIGAYVLITALLIFMITPIMCPTFVFASMREGVSLTSEVFKRLGTESANLVKTPFQLENGNLLPTLVVADVVELSYAFDRDIQSKGRSNRRLLGRW